MKRFLHGHGIAALVALLFSGQSLSAQDAGANTAKNIARMNCGAKIEAVGGAADKNVTSLITDDPTLSYALGAGETTFIITFPATSVLDRFTFVNENAAAEGELTIAVSNYQLPATSAKWTTVNSHAGFTRKRLFDLSLVGVEARYVKLSFRAFKSGRIAALGLYGNESLESFAARNAAVLRTTRDRAGTADLGYVRATNKTAPKSADEMLNFNFANLYAKARVVYVSSGAKTAARRMIDDDTTTAFDFAATDSHPTVIIELAERERLHRVSALYEMQSGEIEVFLLDELGSNPADLSGAKLAASMHEQKSHGKAAVNFDPKGARYVALRWTPESLSGSRSFEVAEIKAFGDVPLAMLNLDVLPESFALNMSTAAAVPSLPPEIPVLSP